MVNYCDKCGRSSNILTVKKYDVFEPSTDKFVDVIYCCEMCYDDMYDDGYGLSLIS